MTNKNYERYVNRYTVSYKMDNIDKNRYECFKFADPKDTLDIASSQFYNSEY